MKRLAGFLFVVFMLQAAGAMACEPIPMTPEQMIASHDTIFTGTVESAVKEDSNFIAVFTVEKIDKQAGDLPQKVKVKSPANTCGIDFQPGQSWMIMGNRDGDFIVTSGPDGSRLNLPAVK